jgi:hypothetical protein
MAGSSSKWKMRWIDFFNNIYAGGILTIACAIASILYTRFGAVWERPIINGLVTGGVVLSLYLSTRALLSLPAATSKITPDEIEPYVLQWLHRFNLTVKRDPINDFHFNYVVTTDGKRNVAVGRPIKDWPDYLTLAAGLTSSEEDQKMLNALSSKDRSAIAIDMKLELARSNMGYSSFSLEGFVIFSRIRITADLGEPDLINAVWRMEAMINALYLKAHRVIIEHAEALNLSEVKENDWLKV